MTAVAVATLTGPFRGESGASTYGKHIKYAGMRTLLASVTIRQLQAVSPSTRSVYTDFAKQQRLPVVEANVGNDTFGFWLGEKSANKVLLWLHGGGYVSNAAPGYMHLLWNLISAAKDEGAELAVFFLEYTTTPEAQYPEQLTQAADALYYLTETDGRSPSSILLGGDSAGGNMALALLSHLSHPQPNVNPLHLKEDLRGAIILSPWVTFDQDSASMKSNAQKDVVERVALKTWSDSFMGNARRDSYNDPKSAPSSWWKGLKVSDICLMAGRDEIFVDDIKALSETMKVSIISCSPHRIAANKT